MRRLIRRELFVYTNSLAFLPLLYRANTVYPSASTSNPSPNPTVEPSVDLLHSYNAKLNVAQPVASFGNQESTSQNSNSELAMIICEDKESRVRAEMVAAGEGHSPREETGDDSNGGRDGEDIVHNSLVVEIGICHHEFSVPIKSLNANVEFDNADLPLVFEGEEMDDNDNGGVFGYPRVFTSDDDLEEED